MAEIRLRFAPSPTGNVHIGNIRTAIFNWLYARHCGGSFLLRVEDTDRQRSTPAAISNLLEVMEWLKLDVDEEPLYQSSRREAHSKAADSLLESGNAYSLHSSGEEAKEAVFFRIPLDCDKIPEVTEIGPVSLDLAAGQDLTVDSGGIQYSLPSRKGKPVPQASCLAGMYDLEVFDEAGNLALRLPECLDEIVNEQQSVRVEGASRISFTRRTIEFTDLIKGRLSKPLDSMRDFVIVRGDGSPVFHLANVCDDIKQNISHVVRGDDHVENTYRHVFLFHALSGGIPQYAHLPMIVNAQGKPYSKRDGDAFVAEFRAKGFLPDALFNYLVLLGWSPGDDREKLSRDELIELFDLTRVQQSSAQMDLRKLENLNGQYIAEMALYDFIYLAREYAVLQEWGSEAEPEQFAAVAELMQTRTKKLTDVALWKHFFVELPDYDDKATAKELSRPGVVSALSELSQAVSGLGWSAENLEECIHKITEKHGIRQGKLNQPLRLALTGSKVGAGIYETAILLGRDKVIKRLDHILDRVKREFV